MKISRRKFLALLGAGIATLIFGRFINFFKPADKKVARYWRRADKLAG